MVEWKLERFLSPRFGRAEKQRMSLGIAIYKLANKTKTQILTGPEEPKRSLWEKLKGKLS